MIKKLIFLFFVIFCFACTSSQNQVTSKDTQDSKLGSDCGCPFCKEMKEKNGGICDKMKDSNMTKGCGCPKCKEMREKKVFSCDMCSKCPRCAKCPKCKLCKGEVNMKDIDDKKLTKDDLSCNCSKGNEVKVALNDDEALKERFKDVKDFDSCVAAGGMVYKTYPPKCKNPLTGEIYTKK